MIYGRLDAITLFRSHRRLSMILSIIIAYECLKRAESLFFVIVIIYISSLVYANKLLFGRFVSQCAHLCRILLDY